MSDYANKYQALLVEWAVERNSPKRRFFGRAPRGWFNVCPINDVAAILEVTERNEAYRILSAFHCTNWCDIPPKIRELIPSLIREALTGSPEQDKAGLALADWNGKLEIARQAQQATGGGTK